MLIRRTITRPGFMGINAARAVTLFGRGQIRPLASLHAGHDVAYFLTGHGAGGCAAAMSYHTASGEPP